MTAPNSFAGPNRRTVAVIQARMGSSRLRGKVLLPFGNQTILMYLVRRLERARTIDGIVVATSTSPDDDVIVEECRRHEVRFFRGSEPDVLGRYVGAAQASDADIVVRVTADNPFTDPDSIDRVVNHILLTDVGYALESRLPIGTTGEALTRDTLDYLDTVSDDYRLREHVTLYAKEHLEETNGVFLAPRPEVDCPNLRLTVDEFVDYLWAKEVRRGLEEQGHGIDFSLSTLIEAASHLTAAA
jgi:spore coat polysaccharide biosynthesis protein SpsF